MRVYLRPRRLKAEEAQGPPAERERLQCNVTIEVQSSNTVVSIHSGMKRRVRHSCGKCGLRETPQAESRGGSRAARGKGAPAVK
ncbi:hypothetical protein [Peribacillus muralis]|uniref:hypothetical protein n=1 Tax=Peribacillus muralis TaxID=264697 RepID=UPI00367169DB